MYIGPLEMTDFPLTVKSTIKHPGHRVQAHTVAGRHSNKNTRFIAKHIVLYNTYNPFLRYSQDIMNSVAKVSAAPVIRRKCRHKGLTIKLYNEPLQSVTGNRWRTKLKTNGITDPLPSTAEQWRQLSGSCLLTNRWLAPATRKQVYWYFWDCLTSYHPCHHSSLP